MLCRIFNIIILLGLSCIFLFAQDAPPDTVFVPGGTILIRGNDKNKINTDTTILVFPGTKVRLKDSEEIKTERFFKNFENQATQKKWIRELHNIIVVSPLKPSRSDSIITEKSVGQFFQHKGLIINDIKIVKLDVFGENLYNDNSTFRNNLITRTANSLHIKTHDKVLQRYILFRPGERIDPLVLSDNERIIRELPFIEDARIVVEKIPGNDEAVNIVLITRDVWSKAFFVELKDVNYVKLELFDRNIFGTGLELQNNFHWNPDKSDALGYEAVYKTNNILGSFINSRFYYTNVFETESYGYNLERKFFTPNTKYAGGTSACYLNTIRDIWHPDSGYFEDKIRLNYFNLWLGRSFLLNRYQPERLNLIIASGVTMEKYHDRPQVSINAYYGYHNKTLWLNSLAISRQSFYKSNFIYSFGRTEDIPTGYMANLTFGPEFSEFGNRFYTSAAFSIADYYNYMGYLYFKAAYGGFHSPGGKFEQGLLDLKFSWFTNLFIFRKYKLRYFTNIYYMEGYKRYIDEKLTLNEPYGLRGFNEKSIFGDKKLVINIESVIFTPVNILGFRLATSAFTDMGFLGEKNAALIPGNMFAGIGLGLRIRNERLVFPTFQLRFTWYPNLPGLQFPDMIRFLGEPRLNPEKFSPDAPAIMNY